MGRIKYSPMARSEKTAVPASETVAVFTASMLLSAMYFGSLDNRSLRSLESSVSLAKSSTVYAVELYEVLPAKKSAKADDFRGDIVSADEDIDLAIHIELSIHKSLYFPYHYLLYII